MNPVNVVVDTSVWIEFFKGKPFPDVERALKEGRVYLSPIVVAELLSGVRSKREETQLMEFMSELPMVETPIEHWIAVGRLRCRCLRKGFSLSTPDAHIAQATLDLNGRLYTQDAIFRKIMPIAGIKVAAG